MMLPRPSRRSTLSWAVNAVTVAMLLSSVWLSAQQRPALQPGFSTVPTQSAPGYGATSEQPAFGVTPARGIDAQRPADGQKVATTARTAFAAGARGIESDSLHQVAYRAVLKP